MCLQGISTKKDLKAADMGDRDAQTKMGEYYSFRKGGQVKDQTQAFSCYMKAAKAGQPTAHYNVGQRYDRGEGVKKDITEAFKRYEAAANQGEAYAFNSLGYHYMKGERVKKDPQ